MAPGLFLIYCPSWKKMVYSGFIFFIKTLQNLVQVPSCSEVGTVVSRNSEGGCEWLPGPIYCGSFSLYSEHLPAGGSFNICLPTKVYGLDHLTAKSDDLD